MGFFFLAIKILSFLILFIFGVVCSATGLYYISEMMEEYERSAKRLIKYAIYVVLVIHILLFIIEGLPFLYLMIGIVMHLIYLRLLPQFPRIELSNLIFVINCLILVINHTAWFKYFKENIHPLDEVLAFYLICVWTIPLFFFIGLTTNDDTLPYGATVNSSGETIGKKSKKMNRIVSFLQTIQDKGKSLLRLENINDYKSF